MSSVQIMSKLPQCDVFIDSSDYSSSEGRPFRLGTGANMEKVVKMDRDMTKVQMLFEEKHSSVVVLFARVMTKFAD